MAVGVNVNAGEVKGTLSSLVKTRNKTLMASMDEFAVTILIKGIFNALICLVFDCSSYSFSSC